MERAGFGIRLVAYIADIIIFSIIAWAISFIYLMIFPEPIDPLTGEPTFGTSMWGSFLLSFILGFIYFVWIPKRMNGQTFGKKLAHIKIVKANGEPLTLWTLFLREFIGKFLSTIILFIGYLMILGKNKRGLHDYIAGTLVLREE